MSKRIRRIVFFVFLFGAFVFLAIKIYFGFLELDKDSTELLPSGFTLTPKDSIIFCNRYLSQLRAIEIFNDLNREPISLVAIDKYYIIIYKFSSAKDLPMNDIINIEKRSVDRSTGISYRVIDRELPFSFQHRLGKTFKISRLYLTIAGDSLLETKKTNDLVNYNMKCENFSIRFSEKEPIDIFFRGKSTIKKIPLSLSFIKKGSVIFMIIGTSMNGKDNIPFDFPLRLITRCDNPG